MKQLFGTFNMNWCCALESMRERVGPRVENEVMVEVMERTHLPACEQVLLFVKRGVDDEAG